MNKKKQPKIAANAGGQGGSIRDRIVALRRVRASDLIPNPRNWRTHPEAQQNALRGILAEVGYVDALLARETPAGLELIDGHLRAETTPDMEVPVLIVDLTEAEADKVLATFDPLSAMAEVATQELRELLENIHTGNEDLAAMLDQLAQDNGIVPGDDIPESNKAIDEEAMANTEHECPKCGFQW